MNSTHAAHATTIDQNPNHFRGFLTKLLHEAFYLEEDFMKENTQRLSEDFVVHEPEEKCDQFNFIHQFLKLRT